MRDELDELAALIEEQRKDQRQGMFQRPEDGVIHLGAIADLLDEHGESAATRMHGRRLGTGRMDKEKTRAVGSPRTCPHGDTYRVQRYRNDVKWGTYCRECKRAKDNARYAERKRRAAMIKEQLVDEHLKSRVEALERDNARLKLMAEAMARTVSQDHDATARIVDAVVR